MTDARGADGELLPDDQRLPRFGRLLRASSLDELPQLWNVVRGDMSLIGPRPLPLTYVDRYSPEQRRRLDAVPGITGWAQVHGRNALDWPTKLALDVWYVDHASPRVDLQILGLTVRAVLTRGGVNAIDHVTMHEFLGDEPRAMSEVSVSGRFAHRGCWPGGDERSARMWWFRSSPGIGCER